MSSKKHFILSYVYAADYFERRDAYRSEHLARLKKAYEEGFLLFIGVLPERPGAVGVFYCEDIEQIRAFAKQDPYVLNGLVNEVRVMPWLPGGGPESILHPES